MTEKEITKALRWFAKVTTHCEHNIVSCPECEFHGSCTDPYSDDGICKMHECLTAAASLIESQAAEKAAYRAENERLAADLKDMRDQNQTISEKNRELCITLDEREKNSRSTQKAMLDEIAKLRNDLAAEQITSQSLRNAANGYKLELDAERKKANDARNELCLKCGRYHEAHNGACDGCRWGEEEQSEGSDT